MNNQKNFNDSDRIKVDLYNAIEEVFPDFNHDEKIYVLIKELQKTAFDEGMNAANGSEE